MSFHFDCVFYYVSDLQRSIRFYRDVLGFPLTSCDAVARFDIDGVLFELVPGSLGAGSATQGNGRVCLRVENVEAALQELRFKGVHVGPAEKKNKGVLGKFQDPDGNEICLWQYGPTT